MINFAWSYDQAIILNLHNRESKIWLEPVGDSLREGSHIKGNPQMLSKCT